MTPERLQEIKESRKWWLPEWQRNAIIRELLAEVEWLRELNEELVHKLNEANSDN